MEDSAVVEASPRIAVTTDSFVVTPIFFPGGDIGKLAVCGTVNDLAMSGAQPRYLTCGFILEEGLDTGILERIVISMASAAREAEVLIVAGDTKVIEGKGGLMINTTGIGSVYEERMIPGAGSIGEGDVILLSGNLGDHHASILSARMQIENTITSDCAPLHRIPEALAKAGVRVRAMRDVTRGGLATVVSEFSQASHKRIVLDEKAIPVAKAVRAFCGILGLDPLYMANEGKMLAVVAAEDAEKALSVMRSCRFAEETAVIGHVEKTSEGSSPEVLLRTAIGGVRVLHELIGEGLPRIC
jgi:hydrogenase expression/formation protein HypE